MAASKSPNTIASPVKEESGPGKGHPEVESVWSTPPEPTGFDRPPVDGPGMDEEPDGIFDGPSEAEDFDEDGTPIEDIQDDDDRRPAVQVSLGAAAVNRRQIYELSVFTRDGGGMACEYNPASWHERSLGNPTLDFNVRKKSDFLRACAAWLESRKSSFLQTRKLVDYLGNETSEDYRTAPLVTAKGFLLRVNSMLPKEQHVPEFNFARILPQIWLVWDDGISMPLAALVSEDARIMWVVEGCRKKCPLPDVWRKILVTGMKIEPKATSTKAAIEVFENQDPAERCIYLFRRAGLRATEDLANVLEQLSK